MIIGCGFCLLTGLAEEVFQILPTDLEWKLQTIVSESHNSERSEYKRWRRRFDVRRLPCSCHPHPFLHRSHLGIRRGLRSLRHIRRVLVHLIGNVALSRDPVKFCKLDSV